MRQPSGKQDKTQTRCYLANGSIGGEVNAKPLECISSVMGSYRLMTGGTCARSYEHIKQLGAAGRLTRNR